MSDTTRRDAIKQVAGTLAALVAVTSQAPAVEPKPIDGKCKIKGCKCPGYMGGYICSNCKHSNSDHI